MSMNLTKLSNAEYPLRDAREAIDGDNALNPADPTAYYTATGNPPGYWIGKGAELVGGKVGTTASSKTVRELINERRNPSNGQYLGDVKLVEGDNGEAPVAGFDLTTRQPKSISILWAFGDKETRDGIDECMRRATEMTIEYFEKEYATTRAGQGGVASVSADGVAGFVFDHYDSRDGDPQPHEHVVLSNRVRRSSDKVWTALDGRKIYASLVEISEVHENLLQDLLTERFGWSWTLRQDTGTKAVVNEVEGVPQELIDAFSGRHAEIAKLVEEKIKEEERQTGKEVGPKRKAQIDLEVWRNTRKAKPAVQPSLQAKREHWYHKLGEVAPDIQLDQMMKDVNSHKSSLMHVDAECEEDVARLLLGQLADLTQLAGGGEEYLDRQAQATIQATTHAHTTWTRSNVRAEAQRLLRGVRIDPKQRIIVANKIADRALGQCVKLTPDRYKLPEDMMDDLSLATHQGRSVFDDADLDKYTTKDVLQAEQYMIEGFNKTANVGYAHGEGEKWLDRWNERKQAQGGYPLAEDQKKSGRVRVGESTTGQQHHRTGRHGKNHDHEGRGRGMAGTVRRGKRPRPRYQPQGRGRTTQQHRLRQQDHRHADGPQRSRTDQSRDPTGRQTPTTVEERVQPVGTTARPHQHHCQPCHGLVEHDQTQPADHRGRGRHGRQQKPAMDNQTRRNAWREGPSHR